MTLFKNNGFSLAEMMIAVGVSGVVLLSCLQMISSFNNEMRAASEAIEFDDQISLFQHYFSRPFRTAVGVKETTSAIPKTQQITVTPPIKPGLIQTNFDSTAVPGANVNTTVSTIALFYRDIGQLSGGAGASSFAATGIYFQQPSNTTYGVLYVSSAVGTTLKPNPGGFTVPNVVSVKTGSPQIDAGFVKSVQVTVTMRFPTTSQSITWCPSCTATGPFKDVTRTFVVMLPDNSGSGTSILPNGRVYLLGRGGSL